MKRYCNVIALLCMGILIGGCGAEARLSYHHDNDPIVIADDEPTLYQFHIIDTYGVNTEFDSDELAISPYVNHGEFEIFWDVFSDGDYFTEIRFNTEPTTDRSRLISSEYCGPGLYCNTHQYQFCDYRSNFFLSCETSDNERQSEYIGDLVTTIPQEVFLIFQVCDVNFFYCEYDVLPVVME